MRTTTEDPEGTSWRRSTGGWTEPTGEGRPQRETTSGPKLASRRPANFSAFELKSVDDIRDFLEHFQEESAVLRLDGFLQDPLRQLTEEETAALEWDPTQFLVANLHRMTRTFTTRLKKLKDPRTMVAVLRSMAPDKKDPVVVQNGRKRLRKALCQATTGMSGR